jgi:hypothetical protein
MLGKGSAETVYRQQSTAADDLNTPHALHARAEEHIDVDASLQRSCGPDQCQQLLQPDTAQNTKGLHPMRLTCTMPSTASIPTVYHIDIGMALMRPADSRRPWPGVHSATTRLADGFDAAVCACALYTLQDVCIRIW